MKILSWNMAHRPESWRYLLSKEADLALLQEACRPPLELEAGIFADPSEWLTAGRKKRQWRAAIVSFKSEMAFEPIAAIPLDDAKDGEFGVSRPGTLAAAHVTANDGRPITLISMYGLWEKPHAVTGSSWIYADASVHRLISDISVLVGQEKGHRIIELVISTFFTSMANMETNIGKLVTRRYSIASGRSD